MCTEREQQHAGRKRCPILSEHWYVTFSKLFSSYLHWLAFFAASISTRLSRWPHAPKPPGLGTQFQTGLPASSLGWSLWAPRTGARLEVKGEGGYSRGRRQGALNVPSKKSFSEYESSKRQLPPSCPFFFFFLRLSLFLSPWLVKAPELPPPPTLLSQPLSPWPIAYFLFLCSVLSTLVHSSLFSAVLWFRRDRVSLQLFSYNPFFPLYSGLSLRLKLIIHKWGLFLGVHTLIHTHTHLPSAADKSLLLHNVYQGFLVCNM